MAPDTLYEVRSYALSNGKLHRWSGYYSRDEAEASLTKRTTGGHAEWAEKHHRDWHVQEIDVRGMFEIPSARKPRDRFQCFSEERPNDPGHWSYRECRAMDMDSEFSTSTWTYRYAGRPPFEPFRQGGRFYALMATNYTGTSVMDLQTGEVIAQEPNESHGFCPVGFYVPDWWDVHDGSVKPGGPYWRDSMEKPDGSYGFVWGCVWGDDMSWKVEYLDLSHVTDGIISRDDRFGYVELATITDNPRDFIHVSYEVDRVEFATLARFELATGKKLGNFE